MLENQSKMRPLFFVLLPFLAILAIAGNGLAENNMVPYDPSKHNQISGELLLQAAYITICGLILIFFIVTTYKISQTSRKIDELSSKTE